MKKNSSNKFFLLYISLILSNLSYSQETNDKKNKVKDIDEIVVTGQYHQQSVDKSIYQVEVISQEDIKNRAASNISDILSYYLNFNTLPNSKNGDSEASLFGLDGQYFKVLIDNIPMVSDYGMGSNVDLTKINLDNVERIEIVRGSMGTDYGSNSLTGIVNIITRKKINSQWKVSGYVQEETVGKEYDWKEQGRHIQSLDISHSLSDKWFLSLGANRNDFKGFFGNKKGKRYYENDGNRGYEWLPKEQWNSNALINYKTTDFNAFYNLQFLNELTNYYNPIVDYRALSEGGLFTYASKDRNFKTDRWLHHLFLSAKLFNYLTYNGDFSYQKQSRKSRDYTYDIGMREVFGKKDAYKKYAGTDAWYTRGTFSSPSLSKILSYQIGYEFNFIEGLRSANSSSIGGMNTSGFQEDLKKHLDNYDVFGSAEIKANPDLYLKPGFRASFNTKFDNQYSYSLAMKYQLSPNSNFRTEVTSTNRTPNFDELYTYFVDTNHNVQGNENLVPEKGYSSSIYWNQKFKSKDNFKGDITLSTLYINLKDKIELATVNMQPLEYKYLNVDKFKTWGVQLNSNMRIQNFHFNLNASYFGVSRTLEDNINGIPITTPDNDYLYTFQLNSNVNYTIKKWDTTFSLFYKYNGKESSYVLDSKTDSYYLGKQDDFNLLDFSVRKSLFNKFIELTAGVRNIFDVKKVNTTAAQAGAHDGPVKSINLFYGRSYFAKLGFNLNI